VPSGGDNDATETPNREGNVPNFRAAGKGHDGPIPAPPRRRLSPDESRQLVHNTLRGFPDGATVAQLAETTGKGQTIIQARLNELAAAGHARSKGRRQPVWFACSH
jgi:hypothetical protein